MIAATPKRFTSAMRGKPVSHVWRGHGSALFLEFGHLTKASKQDGGLGGLVGEISLMIEWSWRIENRSSILCGSWSDEGHWPKVFKRIVGSKVKSVEFFSSLPEISVSLSNGLRVVSFMTADGQPDWAIIAHEPALGSLFVKRGKLFVVSDGS